MKLSPPKQVTWIIALVLGIIGLLGYLITIPVITGLAFWFVLVALALMAASGPTSARSRPRCARRIRQPYAFSGGLVARVVPCTHAASDNGPLDQKVIGG